MSTVAKVTLCDIKRLKGKLVESPKEVVEQIQNLKFMVGSVFYKMPFCLTSLLTCVEYGIPFM